jgi:hypothetical protein
VIGCLWLQLIFVEDVIKVKGIEGVLDPLGHFFDVVFGFEGSEGLEDGEVGQLAVSEWQRGFFAHVLF